MQPRSKWRESPHHSPHQSSCPQPEREARSPGQPALSASASGEQSNGASPHCTLYPEPCTLVFQMPSLRHLFNDHAEHLRSKVIGIYGLLLVFNGAAWLWAVLAFHRFPVLLGTAFLAYSFGLRHAVDAD